jgi:hypothetical protein
MNQARRDTVLLASLILIETVLPFAWAYSEGMMTRIVYWPQRGVWSIFAFLAFGDMVLLALNLWAIQRGEFRWWREGTSTAIIVMILVLIFLPTLAPMHGETDRSRRQMLVLHPTLVGTPSSTPSGTKP